MADDADASCLAMHHDAILAVPDEAADIAAFGDASYLAVLASSPSWVAELAESNETADEDAEAEEPEAP